MKQPASPCTGVCRMDAARDWCKGCRRTLDEIGAWPRLSAKQKRMVLDQLSRRR